MSNGIRLSPKYGLNPSITICWWCGDDKGIALCGKIGDGRKGEDIQAPRVMFDGYEPCDKCKEMMEQGVSVIEAVDEPTVVGQEPWVAQGGKTVYPTHRLLVVKEDSELCEMMGVTEKGKKVLVDSEVMDELVDIVKKNEGEDDVHGEG